MVASISCFDHDFLSEAVSTFGYTNIFTLKELNTTTGQGSGLIYSDIKYGRICSIKTTMRFYVQIQRRLLSSGPRFLHGHVIQSRDISRIVSPIGACFSMQWPPSNRCLLASSESA